MIIITGIRHPHPVSDTAALVMLWANEYYRKNPLIRTYLDHLDLSAGKGLLERYNRVCPWYSEVIVNRKHFIRETVRTFVERCPDRIAIVNLGAGFSPLALELSHLLSADCQFIEIDERNMEQKHALYTDLIPDRCRFITCIEGDITDLSSLHKDLAAVPAAHHIVVMEGLTYYIGRKDMEDVVSSLSGLAAGHSVLFEHLKPCHLINEKRRYIPYEIFSHVRDYTGLDRMTTYSCDDIRELFPRDYSCNYFDMSVMEHRRTGLNRYFPAADAGWLSCAVLSK